MKKYGLLTLLLFIRIITLSSIILITLKLLGKNIEFEYNLLLTTWITSTIVTLVLRHFIELKIFRKKGKHPIKLKK